MLVLCACVLVAQSMVAAVNLLIPELAASSLHPSHSEILWTVDAYVIAFAGLLIPAGALGDRYGRKGALLAGLGLFAAGAGTSALAPDPAVLIAGRGLSGAGAALIGLGLLGASTVDAATPYWTYACWLLVISAGTGLSMPALTLGVVGSLPPHQAGLGSGLGTTARETGAALGVAVTGTILSEHGDLASGMGPALRTVALLVLAATALVVAGHGGRTPTRTIASGPERVLSRSSGA
ncbi:MFS transporter [Streptomyces sp. NPDC051987]|uniref:MFS transporter n=1 Tax=Streptomyces sp. NPDC051987 TaxID=3155808 RepID=UPI0034194072